MEKYDYYTAIYNDVANYIKDNNIDLSEYGDDIEDITETLSDELWDEDSITGNGGSGYDTNFNCEEYLCHNLNLLFEAMDEYGYDPVYHDINKENLPKFLDSLIRCHILYSVIYTYIKDNFEENKNEIDESKKSSN